MSVNEKIKTLTDFFYYPDECFQVNEYEYPAYRKLVEDKFKKYFEVFVYSEYTKELILDMATRTYKKQEFISKLKMN